MSTPSPVTPDTIKALLPSSNGNACSKFAAALIGIPTKIYSLLKWMLDSNGNFTPEFLRNAIRTGVIVMTGEAAPGDDANWKLCNGQELLKTDFPDLYAAVGDIWGTTPYPAPSDGLHFRVPNIKDRFPVGVGGIYSQGGQGGEATHVLTIGETPAHHHAEQVLQGGGGNNTIVISNVGTTTVAASGQDTADTGGGAAHNNLPPYVGLFFLIKT